MNNKGITLLEILISLVLISIVMIFLFSLISDLRNEDSLSKTRSVDAVNRSTIINIVQNDFINKELIKVEGCSTGQICMKFIFKDESYKYLQVYSNNTENYLTYGPDEGKERWDLSYGKYDLNNFSYNFVNKITQNGTVTNSPYYYLRIYIPIVVDTNSKRKYDIELTKIGENKNIKFTKSININGKNYQ